VLLILDPLKKFKSSLIKYTQLLGKIKIKKPDADEKEEIDELDN